jgi:hypothetical protein
VSGIAVRKPHSIGGNRVNVRRGNLLASLAAQVGIAQIIGQNDNNVWSFLASDNAAGSRQQD